MSDRKTGRGGNCGRRQREDREDSGPQNEPYTRSTRGRTRNVMRTYERLAGEMVEAQTREAEELREEMRRSERMRRLREDLRSLYIEVDGNETEQQLEKLLDDHNEKYRKLQAVGFENVILLDDRDVKRGWERYEKALSYARIWGVLHDENTAVQELERLVREKCDAAGVPYC